MKKEKETIPFMRQFYLLGFLIAIMAASISIYEADPHIPMLVGNIICSPLIALKIGYSWDEIQTSNV